MGVVPTTEALKRAEAAGLDLVQISNADPIVCKIMDYGKFVFETKKAKKQATKEEAKANPGQGSQIPSWHRRRRLSGEAQNLTRFLEGGDKGKVTLRFRGREMAHQDIGRKLMERIASDLEEIGAVESFPKMEGRQMIMILAPKKK